MLMKKSTIKFLGAILLISTVNVLIAQKMSIAEADVNVIGEVQGSRVAWADVCDLEGCL